MLNSGHFLGVRHHLHEDKIIGLSQWGIKREKKSFRLIDPLLRTPGALDLTRSALHALCSVHIQCADRRSSVHCMPCSKKNKVETFEGRAPPPPLDPPLLKLCRN